MELAYLAERATFDVQKFEKDKRLPASLSASRKSRVQLPPEVAPSKCPPRPPGGVCGLRRQPEEQNVAQQKLSGWTFSFSSA